MHERFRDILLASWGRVVAARPVLTLSVCLAVAAASLVFTAVGLEFHADRSALVDPNESWNKRYAQYKGNFPHYLDAIVVLDGAADDTRVDELARTIADRLHLNERIVSADAGFDAGAAGPTSTAGAAQDVDVEHPGEQVGPESSGPAGCTVRSVGILGAAAGPVTRLGVVVLGDFGRLWHDPVAIRRSGSQDPVVREQVHAGSGYERREPGEEGHGIELDRGGPIAPGSAELVVNAAVGCEGQALSGERRPCEVARERLASSVRALRQGHLRLQREAVEIGAEWALGPGRLGTLS